MEDQNSTEFSSLRSNLPEMIFEVSEEICEKHNLQLVKFSNRLICPVCAKELTEQSSNELANDLTEKHYENLRKKKDKNLPENYIDKSLMNDKKVMSATLDSYNTMDDETSQNKIKAMAIAEQYKKGKVFNTILSGKVGTGKTHLAIGILKKVNEEMDVKQKCLAVSSYKLLNMLRATYGVTKEENNTEDVKSKLVKLCAEPYLLVIDDLGAEVGSKNNKKVAASDNFDLINNILEERMDLPTIITTNLRSEDIESIYDDRIRSRVLSGVTQSSIIKFEKTKDKRNNLSF